MPATATITAYTTFSALTKIKSSEVNDNFSNHRGHSIPIDATAASAANNTYDLGSSDYMWRNLYLAGEVRLYEAASNGSNYIAHKADLDVSTTTTYVWPIDGSAGQVLKTDGSGNLDWVSPLTNPMTTEGDIIVGATSGAATRVPIGASGTFLQSSGTTVQWYATDFELAAANVAAFSTTADTWGDLTSLALPAGTWNLAATAMFNSNGATTTTLCRLGIGTVSGNDATGVGSSTQIITTKQTTSGTYDPLTLAPHTVTITTTTTYYLKARADTSITNLRAAYSFFAWRVA